MAFNNPKTEPALKFTQYSKLQMSTEKFSQPVSAASVVALGSKTQTQLLLHKAGQPYKLSHWEKIPDFGPGEILVQVCAIGLNPIDWKSA